MNGSRSSIDSVRSDLPTLERALRLQETAAAAGLDWPEAADVWSRINEELAEAKAASEDLTVLGSRIAARTSEKAETLNGDSAHSLLVDELGELLFAVVDVCRVLGVNPDQALSRANGLFATCFNQLEQKARTEGRMLALEHPAVLKRLWDQTKRLQREKSSAANIIWPGIGRNGSASKKDEDRKESAQA